MTNRARKTHRVIATGGITAETLCRLILDRAGDDLFGRHQSGGLPIRDALHDDPTCVKCLREMGR